MNKDNIEYFDYKNPKRFFKQIKKLEKLLDDNEFSLFLYGGTLLGSIRSQDLIKHDDDFDLFYISKQTRRKTVLNEFENVIKPLLENNGWEIQPISWNLNGDRVMMGQYHIIKNNISLDIWTAWFDDKGKFNVTMTIENDKFTYDDIMPPVKSKIQKYWFNAPQKSEMFLEHLYGKDWRVPDSKYKIPCNGNFLQKKILKVIDQFGWAYYFIAKEQQKYSYQAIEYKRVNDIKDEQLNYDIVYFHSPGMAHRQISNIIRNNINHKKTKIIGAYGGENPQLYSKADLIVTISFPYLQKLKKLYPEKSVIFLPEALDVNFFSSSKKQTCDFSVGYVGRPCKVKRMHLLDRLDFEIKKHTEWGAEYFVEGRTLDSVKDFYDSIDCLVLTSQSECMPRVVLEAMAMGIPVVSTDVGCIRMLLEPEWIVSNTSEDDIVKNINDKLHILKKYKSVRKQVGERNRQYIVDNFNWESIQPVWDEVCNALCLNDYEKINKIGLDLENKWEKRYSDFLYINREDLNTKEKPTLSEKIVDIINPKKERCLSTQNLIVNLMTDSVLLSDSCLNLVKEHRFDDNEVFLGGSLKHLQSIEQKLLEHRFTKENSTFFKDDYIVHLNIYTESTKNYGCKGLVFKVPFPVIGYLDRLYNKSWRDN